MLPGILSRESRESMSGFFKRKIKVRGGGVEQLAIFIDGRYLDKVKENVSGREFRMDFAKFSQKVCGYVKDRSPTPVDLLRTYYYDCLPYKSDPPTTEENQKFESARRFHSALELQPRTMIRRGKLKRRDQICHSCQSRQPGFQQKGVDILLGVDLVLASVKGHIAHAAIVAGDSDFLPAVEIVKAEGVVVWLFHERASTSELALAADERIEINREFLKDMRRAGRSAR